MLELLIKYEKIDQFDRYLADLLVPEKDETLAVYYCVLLLSRAVRSQHSCLPLNNINLSDPFNLKVTEHGRAESPFNSKNSLYQKHTVWSASQNR